MILKIIILQKLEISLDLELVNIEQFLKSVYIDVFQKNKKKETLKMHTIKLTREEAEELAKYIEVNKKVKLEHEQGEFELYLLRLEKILEKYKTSKNQDGIDVDVTEFRAFAIYQRW